MRLIDADYLIDALSGFNDTEHGDKQFLFGIASAKEIVEYAETIDAELVRHGHWNEMRHFGKVMGWLCSICGCGSTYGYMYCPYCGARMDG